MYIYIYMYIYPHILGYIWMHSHLPMYLGVRGRIPRDPTWGTQWRPQGVEGDLSSNAPWRLPMVSVAESMDTRGVHVNPWNPWVSVESMGAHGIHWHPWNQRVPKSKNAKTPKSQNPKIQNPIPKSKI